MNTVQLGTTTRWGTVAAIGWITGERYYWLTNGPDDVAMLPASVVEGDAVATRTDGGAVRCVRRLDGTR